MPTMHVYSSQAFELCDFLSSSTSILQDPRVDIYDRRQIYLKTYLGMSAENLALKISSLGLLERQIEIIYKSSV